MTCATSSRLCGRICRSTWCRTSPKRRSPGAHALIQLLTLTALLCAPLAASAGQGGSRSDNSSQGSGDGAASRNDSEMTTLVLGIGTVITAAGVTYGSYRLTAKSTEAGKVAEIYLRRHAIALRQDLCLGRGPQLGELLAALPLAPAQRPAYAKSLLSRRRELLALAAPAQLNPERALRFFEIVTDLLPRPVAAKS